MNKKNIVNVVSRVVLIAVALVSAGLINQAPVAQAAQDYRDDYVRWDKARESRFAYLLGYHQSYSEGRDTRGYRANYKDMPGYREGTNGYLTWMGSRDTYRDSYRKGYEDGFRDAQSGRSRRYDRDDVEQVLGDSLKRVYDDQFGDDGYRGDYGHDRGRGRDSGHYGDGNYGRYDRNQIYRIAQQNGYREGLRHGEEDRARRVNYNYDHSSAYRDASSGYRSEYRDRELYRQGYRDGYHRGYDEGYRRGRDTRTRWPF